jgi:subtilisin family serine protease
MKTKAIIMLTMLLTWVLGVDAQSVMTSDAMIRVAGLKAKMERTMTDGQKLSPAQQPTLMLVVKVDDEGAADTYARMRELGATIRGRIGQQAIVQVALDKVDAFAQIDGIRRVDVGHKGELKTDVSRLVTGVDLVNGSTAPEVSSVTGKGVTVCVTDMGMDFHHPAFQDAQGRSRIKCVYSINSERGRKFVYEDPVAGTVEFPGSVFDTPELISKLVYDIDQTSHGSHTTGIAAGSLSPQGFGGMAPEADIVYVPLTSLFTEDDLEAYTHTESTKKSTSNDDPDPNEIEESNQLLELVLAFVDAYAQQSSQPLVLSSSLGSHLGPHDGSGTVPEAISALSKHAIPVFSCGNEGGSAYHLQHLFDDDNPSFSTLLGYSLAGVNFEEIDPENAFLWKYSHPVLGYTRPGQGGEISMQLNVIKCKSDFTISENVWSSPAISCKLNDPDKMVTINSADYPEVENYFKGKVLLSIRTLESGRMELLIMPDGFCKVNMDETFYAISITMKGSAGAAVDLWQSGVTFPNFKGEGYISGDDLLSGSDWTSTPDVISVGAWCANTTMRAYMEGKTGGESATETLGDIATFSSYGAMFNGVNQPVVCAPGVFVVSSWNKRFDLMAYGEDAQDGVISYIDNMTWQGYPYGPMSGTSMSCPAVAGIIALWLQANPRLTLEDVKDVLAHSCDNDDFTASNPVRWGYGKINAKKGLDYIQKQVTTGISTLSPKVKEGVYYNLQGQRVTRPTKGLYISPDKRAVFYRHR